MHAPMLRRLSLMCSLGGRILARMHAGPPIIVLTGGPGGGETTLMRELRAEDPDCRQWVLVPEAAPLLFQAGLSASNKAFQAAVVRLQLTLEEACALAAPPGAALVCHRGVLDPLAYWLMVGWEEEEFFPCAGFKRAELLARYTSVLHLQTTAIGAEAFYLRWPDAHRPETAEQAAGIDRSCLRAWDGHHRHVVLENGAGGWEEKSRRAHQALDDFPGPLERLQQGGIR
jgi:hypothetical protein